MSEPTALRPGAGADDDDHEEPTAPLPKSAEDRKALAALSALDDASRTTAAEDDGHARTDVDQEALGKAMKNLGSAGGAGAGKGGEGQGQVVRKKVKIDQGDVGLLVEELDLSKTKAVELLRQHDGDAVKAIRAFIAPTFA